MIYRIESATPGWHPTWARVMGLLSLCSDPSYESDPSNEYSPLGLTQVMNSIFLDPSNEFLTQAVNIGIPKQTLGLAFMFQNEATK